MLSNDTKLIRINEKLSIIGAKLEWACYDLKTYKPFLRNLKSPNSIYFNVEGYNVRLKVFMENNRIIFGLGEIPNIQFNNYDQFNHFYIMIKTIKDILDSCNRYGLEIPKYEK